MDGTVPTMETICPICKLLKNMWKKSFTLFKVLDLGIEVAKTSKNGVVAQLLGYQLKQIIFRMDERKKF
jgi:hypothetical protein